MSAAGLPAFGVTAAALRLTTERLAIELVSPQDRAPEWNDFQWQVARAAAAMQGTTVLLAHRLRWRGPASWQQFVETQCRLSTRRDAHIAATLVAIDAALRRAGVACVGLKGSALRALGFYRPGERPMADVDLLARPADAARVEKVLESLGFTGAFRKLRHVIFTPPKSEAPLDPGDHPDNLLKIELHQVIAEPLPIRAVDITASLWSDEAGPGLIAYPHARELMRHLLLHAAGNVRAHALRQIQLHDIARLGGRLTDADWRALLDTPESHGGAWWMWPVLDLTGRYYPGALPACCAGFRERCPRLLRMASARQTLTAVSWSNLRIAAFPGLAWARSPREAAGFMRSRMMPQRADLDDLAVALESMPALRSVRWYEQNHATRVLRWIFSRPPRVQTMRSVLDAIATQPARQ